jgi:hypothetical protein
MLLTDLGRLISSNYNKREEGSVQLRKGEETLTVTVIFFPDAWLDD